LSIKDSVFGAREIELIVRRAIAPESTIVHRTNLLAEAHFSHKDLENTNVRNSENLALEESLHGMKQLG
jgi:hypothetical protein